MRILITNESRAASGGIETYLKTLAPQLLSRGNEIGWLFGHSPSSGTRITTEDCTRVWGTDPHSSASVRSEIRRWQPDVVYANGLQDPCWDAWLAEQFPTVFFAHGYFGACISGRKCHAVGELEVCQRKLGPACLMLYLPRRCGGRSPVRMLRDYRRERYRQRNLKLFRKVVVASQYMANEFLRQGVSIDRLHVLPLFPTGTTPDIKPPERRETWTNRVLMVGRLTELKGTAIAAKAVSIASKILNRTLTLVVVGNGPGQATIERDASQYHVPLEILGWTGYEERNAAMRNADALLVPSLWPEPFGLVGIEAGCAGLPAVAFDVGGIRDWLHHGISGELVSETPPSPQCLGKSLAELLSDVERHHRLQQGAWSIAKQYHIERHVDQLTAILQR